MPKILNLSPDEHLVKIVYQHPIVLKWKIILAFILIAAPFFFLSLLLQLEKIGLIIFFTILFIGLVYTFRTIFIWRATRFYITSEKIIDVDQTSFFNKTITHSALENILDISYKYKGLTQNLFNFGDLSIVISQGTSKILLKNIPKPERIQKILQNLIETKKSNTVT